MNIDCAVASRSKVGEGAVWDPQDDVLWWVDIPDGLIHRFDPETGVNRTSDFGEPVGCVAPRKGGGLVVAAKSGFWLFDPETCARSPVAAPEEALTDNRFNDGTTDRQGRLWAGTMTEGGGPAPGGSFYRLDPDLSVSPWRGGFFTTNGLAFSPDGRIIYFSDSHPSVRTVWQAPYDPETGTPGTPSVLLDTRGLAGRPDGATVDADGCYWVAGVGGWQLYRVTPGGRIDRTIDLPLERPTRPMFGGRGLDTLFVTSIGAGLTPGTESRQPAAGGLFALTGLGVSGLPQARFGG
jgi:sugar lactone lactonase YvrE